MVEARLVLVVDDVDDNRAMYAELLELEGFRAIEADDGVQALAVARKEVPDAIIMDIGLPSIDGIEATRMLRADQVTRRIVVIALSGHGSEVEARALAAGVDGFLRKPCFPHEIVALLRTLLDARLPR